MASNKKPSLEENRISASGWTMPWDVVGDLPAPRPEVSADCEALVDMAWMMSAPRWVGTRFALLAEDGYWSTGQEDLFGSGGTAPEGSWPKQLALNAEGVALEIRPWAPRPAVGDTMPTPVSYDATPGGPGNHYKGLGHQAKHGGELFSTPTASTATGADMVQALFSGNDPDRPAYAEATEIFMHGKPGIWRTPSARDFKGADPKNATGRQIGLNDQVKAQGMMPSPNAHGGLYGGQGSRQILLRRVASGEITQEEAEAMLGATISPTDTGRAPLMLPTPTVHGNHNAKGSGPDSGDGLATAVLRAEGLFPTPTGTERAGTNPKTGKGGGLSRHVKDEAGIASTPRQEIVPTPMSRDFRSGKTSDETAARNSRPLNEHVVRAEDNPKTGQLNPDWVDLLMGYRLGTTVLVPEAEEWFKIDARRLKAADLKKLHSMDDVTALPEEADGEAEPE